MICYRDMTFCVFKDCKKWSECGRAFTEEVEAQAREWGERSGFEPGKTPVCYFSSKPECFEGDK